MIKVTEEQLLKIADTVEDELLDRLNSVDFRINEVVMEVAYKVLGIQED